MTERDSSIVEFAVGECERSVVDRIRTVAEASPESPAISGFSGDDPEVLTYREVVDRVDSVARCLAPLGVSGSASPRVGVLMAHEPAAIVAQLSVLAAGGVAVPLDHLGPPNELAEVLRSSAPVLVIVDDTLSELLGRTDVAVDSISWQTLLERSESGADAAADLPAVSGADAAYLLYTSGSVGESKGATTLHGAFLRPVQELFAEGQMRPSDRVAVAAPLPFMAAVDMSLWTLCTGGELCLFSVRERGPMAFVGWMAERGITVWGTATAAMRGLSAAVPPGTLPALRLIMVGGEVLYGDDVERARLLSQVDLDVMAVYAATEVPLMAWNLVDSSSSLEGLGAIGVGRAVAGTTLSLEVPESAEPGSADRELVVESRVGSLGYWERPDLAGRFEFDAHGDRMRYRTGDLGAPLDDGGIEIVGRIDFMVKVRGRQVNLPFVEEALRGDDRVSGAAVVAVDGPDGSRQLVGHVTPEDGHAVDPDELRLTIRRSLPAHMVPVRIVVHESLPMTGRGKVDRTRLVSMSDRVATEPSRDPATATERRVHRVWAAVLGRSDFGVEEDFFDLGGDSLAATELMIALEKEFGLWQPLSSWIDDTTVEAIATTIEGRRTERSSRLTRIQQGDPDRPPLVVVYDLHGGAFRFRDFARSIGVDQEVWGLENPMLDGFADMPRTVEDLARLHVEDLRAQFGDQPIHLVGYSGAGSFLAYELARQLIADGAEVGLLCLIDFGPVHLRHGGDPDSYRPPGSWPNRPRSDVAFRDRVRLGVADVRSAGSGRRLSRASRLVGAARQYDLAVARLDEARTGRVRPELRTAVMWYRLMDALVDYRFEPVDTDAVLLVSDQTAKGNIAVSRRLDYSSLIDPSLGWEPYLKGGISLREVVGHHNDLMEPPYVEGVGRVLREAFDEWVAARG